MRCLREALGSLDFLEFVHPGEICQTTGLRYHLSQQEVYHVCTGHADTWMQLDQKLIPVWVKSGLLIRLDIRHRAAQQMALLILVLAKFDPTDEWFH